MSKAFDFPFGHVNDIDVFDADSIWVTSDGHPEEEDDHTAIARWDGRRWAQVKLPGDFGQATMLQVRVAEPEDVWVSGYGSGLVGGGQWREIWRWDGSTWHEVNVPTAHDDLAVVASDDAWVVGIIEQRAHHWDGSRWRAFDLPGASGCFDRLEAVAADDVWAFGRNPCHSNDYSSKAIAAHWDGTTWTEAVPPKLAPLAEITAIGPDDLWATSGPTITHWDGHAWSAVDPPPSKPESFSAIASDGAGGLWVTNSTTIGPTSFMHRDKAGRWTTHDDPTGDSTIEDIALVSGTRRLWAVGGEDFSGLTSAGSPLLVRYDP